MLRLDAATVPIKDRSRPSDEFGNTILAVRPSAPRLSVSLAVTDGAHDFKVLKPVVVLDPVAVVNHINRGQREPGIKDYETMLKDVAAFRPERMSFGHVDADVSVVIGPSSTAPVAGGGTFGGPHAHMVTALERLSALFARRKRLIAPAHTPLHDEVFFAPIVTVDELYGVAREVSAPIRSVGNRGGLAAVTHAKAGRVGNLSLFRGLFRRCHAMTIHHMKPQTQGA